MDRAPRAFFRGLEPSLGETVTQLGVLKQPLEPGEQGTGVSRFHEERVRSLVGELEDPAIGNGE